MPPGFSRWLFTFFLNKRDRLGCPLGKAVCLELSSLRCHSPGVGGGGTAGWHWAAWAGCRLRGRGAPAASPRSPLPCQTVPHGARCAVGWERGGCWASGGLALQSRQIFTNKALPPLGRRRASHVDVHMGMLIGGPPLGWAPGRLGERGQGSTGGACPASRLPGAASGSRPPPGGTLSEPASYPQKMGGPPWADPEPETKAMAVPGARAGSSRPAGENGGNGSLGRVLFGSELDGRAVSPLRRGTGGWGRSRRTRPTTAPQRGGMSEETLAWAVGWTPRAGGLRAGLAGQGLWGKLTSGWASTEGLGVCAERVTPGRGDR